MQIDKNQILSDYRAAKNNKRHIQILADLNDCSKEKIIEILREGGYKMIFNTNGVDISAKYEEINAAYQSGKTIKELSEQYHVSKKGIGEVLGITEDKVVNEGQTEIDVIRAENEKLSLKCKELTKECDYLKAEIAEMKEKNKSVCKGDAAVDDIYEKYQSICIRNSQLNATVDTLIDKISMLKAVGCNGR